MRLGGDILREDDVTAPEKSLDRWGMLVGVAEERCGVDGR